MPQKLDEVEQLVLDRELKAQDEAKKALAGEGPGMENIINDFVAQCDDPNYFRTVYDKLTGQKVVLTDQDLEVIDRIRKAIYPDPNYDPYEPYVDFFSNEVSIHPVMNRPEPKAAFVPSLSEKRALTKLVALIRSGRIKPYKPRRRDREPYKFSEDLWLKEGDIDNRRHRALIPAPKMQLPGHAESYNPPPEYLLTSDDIKKWESEEEREHMLLPQRYTSLREVPFYKNILKERFERCLELYMCPRQRIRRAKVDPEALIPKLPRPKDLQPFPSSQSMLYKGHTGIVHSVSVEPQGQFIVSGSEDCTVKFWEVLNGRCWRTIKFESPVRIVSYCPNANISLVAVVTSRHVYLVNSQLGDSAIVKDTDILLDTIESELASNKRTQEKQAKDGSDSEDDGEVGPNKIGHRSNQPLVWSSTENKDGQGVRMILQAPKTVDQFTWHPRGDYFAIVMPEARSLSLVVTHLARHQSQYLFKKGKYLVQRVAFHPKKPRIFAADDRQVLVYDVSKKEIVKKLITGLKSSSCLAVHPGGDNLLLGSFDPRLVWFDTDLSVKPYKIMRYHTQAIRNACFHKKYPLFASCSDDAHVIVSHGNVYDDLAENALIVPLKILHGHEHCSTLAVTDCKFHHSQPWIFSSGADKTVRLYT